MIEPENTKSISELLEDDLERYLNTLTFGQAQKLARMGITFEIDYKNKRIVNVVIER